jgi:uncharacterized protein
MRLLLILLGLIAVFFIVRVLLRQRQRPGPTVPAVHEATRTVRCAECGVHLPAHEAIHQDGQVFCCTEHARAWTSRSRR